MGLRILIIGANPFLQSAYGNIVRYLANTLSIKHQVFVYGEGWQGNLCKMGRFVILPSQITSEAKEAASGAMRVMQAIFRYKPFVTLSVGDLVSLEYFSRFRKRPFWIAHFPVDSEPFRNIEVHIMKRADIRIIPSRYGVDVLRRAHNVKSYYLPHPVGEDFKPIDKKIARKAFRISPKDFIFGFVGMNTNRKKIPRLMEAFANEFRGNKRVKLWLHCNRRDQKGWDLPYLADYFKITKQVIYTPYLDYFTLTPAELNLVYNSLDVLCIPSAGEGFCMPIAEAAACGMPCIGTDYSAIPEVMGEGGIKVPYVHKYIDVFASWKALVDIPKFGEAMRTLYENPTLKGELSAKALEKSKEYEYSKVMGDYLTFFDLLGESKEFKAFRKWTYRDTMPSSLIKRRRSKKYLKGT